MASSGTGEVGAFGQTGRLRLVDLFAGCGGLTAGFHQTGRYESVAAVEHDLAAAATYAANFGEDHVYWGDIGQWVYNKLPDADVVVGGPPCQGFSNLGSRWNRDPRNALWRRYVDALIRIEPKVFLLENVARFAKSGQFNSLVRATYRNGPLRNYRLHHAVVTAANFGAAQLRQRVIVIGTHRDLPPIHAPTDQIPESQWLTVRDTIGDLANSVDPEMRDLPETTTQFFGRTVGGVYKATDLDFARSYTDLSAERFRHIPEGGNRFDLPDSLKAPCWLGHETGSYDVLGRAHWDRPSVTIRTEFFKPEKGRYLHPTENRALTHHEAARLQGFDDDFLWCGKKIEIARQIGNAVPVPMARSLAEYIADALSPSTKTKNEQSVSQSEH
jgi:DNA (cytosine-5)-methyltransferase 1